ncbi:MAG: hypothetical protein H7178_06355 [Chitinophagaceae bacterium]|nr:hypothetical protein [Chitinophagaceae bacterium]
MASLALCLCGIVWGSGQMNKIQQQLGLSVPSLRSSGLSTSIPSPWAMEYPLGI